MTVQEPDWLILEDGERLPVNGASLCDDGASLCKVEGYVEGVLRLGGRSSNWRGYVATWRIEKSKLYLEQLVANFKGGGPANISDVFPRTSPRPFAGGFSGTLTYCEWLPGGVLSEREVRFQFEGLSLRTSATTKGSMS